MSKSLQEQLLKAGLVSTKQVKQSKASKSKEQRQKRHQKNLGEDNSRQEIAQKAAEKAKRDLELNRKREEEKQRRAIEAQIKQLVDENLIAEDDEGEAFHFNHNGLVKKVYVSDPIRNQIINGQLAIVLSKKRYRIVPTEVAEKIRNRDDAALVFRQQSDRNGEPSQEIDADYAEYRIPDDLIW